jgi:peptidoglycan/xylan/chitin deacetylase (PgdA/CDA1 family)
MFKKIIIILFAAAINLFPQYGVTYVKQWADDKKSAYTFSLDDGLQSQAVYARSVLNKYGFKGSFMVIADHLTDVLPGNYRYTSWQIINEISNEGHEIASHSLNHPDLTQIPVGDIFTPGTAAYEIYRSKEKVDLKVPAQKCITFAYPLAVHNDEIRQITSLYYESARGAGEIINDSVIYDWMNLHAAAPIFNSPRNTLEDDLPELEIHKSLINSSIESGGWTIGMFHEIVPQTELAELINLGLWNPISSEWFDLLCLWLQEKSSSEDIWVSTMADITKYVKQRETFSSSVILQNDNEIRLKITDQMDDIIFDHPLTIDVTIPPGWNYVRVIQGNSHTINNSFQSGDDNIVRINAVPDKGEVILMKAAGTEGFQISGKVIYHNNQLTPVPDVLITINGNNFNLSVTTDDQGYYSFTNLPAGNYNISCSKEDNFSGVNATDALLILRNEAGLHSFDDYQKRAADVDNSSIIDSKDADIILNRFTGIKNDFLIDDWFFFLKILHL